MSESNGAVIRLGAVADLHYTKTSQGVLSSLFEQAGRLADVLLLPGDLTDLGLPDEARVLARDLKAAVKIPVVAVLGNHDFEAGKADEVADILRDAGVTVLDGDAVEIRGVGIGGAKGFLGGFGRGTLEAWGEPAVKAVVQATVDEVLKLEKALARLRAPQRIALLHYAPVRGTVEGEPVEIHAFMGCGRFEEPLNRYGVHAVFHGHAHRGAAEGKTSAGIPVYNVALPLLRRAHPEGPALRILELAGEAGALAAGGMQTSGR
ncbi:MAG TPA: metallophosphoesterase [Gemmataceae bacterium]|nr:metallophosphoesterase [Gemmataceae bacterium]